MHNAKSTHITRSEKHLKQIFPMHHFLPRSTESEWFGLEQTFKGHLVHRLPWAGTSSTQSACSDLALNVSRDGAFTTSLGNLCWCFFILITKHFFLIPGLFSFKTISSCASTTGQYQKSGPICLTSSLWVLKGALRSPQGLLQAEPLQLFPPCLYRKSASSLWLFLWACSELNPTGSSPSCIEDSRAGHSIPDEVSQEQGRGAEPPNHLP